MMRWPPPRGGTHARRTCGAWPNDGEEGLGRVSARVSPERGQGPCQHSTGRGVGATLAQHAVCNKLQLHMSANDS
jgi:hypothetical protein